MWRLGNIPQTTWNRSLRPPFLHFIFCVYVQHSGLLQTWIVTNPQAAASNIYSEIMPPPPAPREDFSLVKSPWPGFTMSSDDSTLVNTANWWFNEAVHPSLGTRCQDIELNTSYDHISVNPTSAGMQNVWSEITRKRTLESGTPAGMQNVWSEITRRGLWENGTPAGMNAWSEITKKGLWENGTPAGMNAWSEITKKGLWENGTPAGMNVWSEITRKGLWENATPAGMLNAWSEIIRKGPWR